MAQSSFDVVVIGEGISGLSAAHALAQSGLRTATLEAQLFGGLVLNVNELNPAPDPSHSVSGAEIASELMQANADLGVVSIQEAATGIRDRGATKQITTAAATYEARQVVVASGARLKKLGVAFEEQNIPDAGYQVFLHDPVGTKLEFNFLSEMVEDAVASGTTAQTNLVV